MRRLARRRGDARRQDQPRPVRHRADRRPLAVRQRARASSAAGSSPAAPAPARRSRSPRARSASPWVRTPPAPAGCRRRSTGSSASNRPGACSARPAWCPACRSLDCVSVFTADVADAVDVLHAARGRHAGRPVGPSAAGRPVVAPPAGGRSASGCPGPTDLDFFGDTGQADRFAAGVQRLRDPRGSRAVRCRSAPSSRRATCSTRGPGWPNGSPPWTTSCARTPSRCSPVTRAVLETGRRYDAVDAFRGQHRLRELRAQVDRLWQDDRRAGACRPSAPPSPSTRSPRTRSGATPCSAATPSSRTCSTWPR